MPAPSWLSWLERQSHNLKVVSSSLTEGMIFCPPWLNVSNLFFNGSNRVCVHRAVREVGCVDFSSSNLFYVFFSRVQSLMDGDTGREKGEKISAQLVRASVS